ncbi:threonine synthase [uncultured Ruminococcus sp.]|uniref:threonine synthase n=1 Tax=uncultured Ruminococcus sp. TaxID=165186 RepID=UPI00292E6085|nr:threonine synthase [uncultured Ruminococcus sp.]
MYYNSTQDKSKSVASAQAIAQGISQDGGLFVPESFPQLTADELKGMLKMSYRDRAKLIISKYLTDFTQEEIADCVDSAYTVEKFGSANPAPLAPVSYNGAELNLLELWHGPTCAFKDMALQILPHFLTKSLKKVGGGKDAVILVATSGDTGKAALEGFRDVEHTKIIVFYPVDGVSAMQKHQMNTQQGDNVYVCAIRGNFDDAQTAVKRIFTDPATAQILDEHNMMFSSANSINWGRLLPQIVYYISAYCDMVNMGKTALGEKINITVPTGNFGNILAAYYAYEMGLPVNRFICASNSNNVLTDFIRTGVYNKNRDFYTTVSPSMDILVSSNLERLLYTLSGNNDAETKGYMDALKSEGRYEVSDSIKTKIQALFWGGYADENSTRATIHDLFEQQNYLCDTHTAVAVSVCDAYIRETGDNTPVVIASTASPYKFSKAVLGALNRGEMPESEFDMVDRLHEITGAEVPAPLASLKGKTARFGDVTDKEDMQGVVLRALGIEA